MKFRIVLPSIEPLKTSGTRGLTPGSRLSAWVAAASDSAYCSLVVYNYTFLSKLCICFISFLILGYWAKKPEYKDMVKENFTIL